MNVKPLHSHYFIVRQVIRLFLLVSALYLLAGPGVMAQTVTSDKDDYAPGEIAIITGAGWMQDSLVDVHFEEEPSHDHHHGYHDTRVNPDGTWRIEYPIEDRHLGVKFTVIVVGQQTGIEKRANFTDGQLHELTIGNQSVVPTFGVPTQVQYQSSIRVAGNNNSTATITLDVEGLPSGVTFSPATISVSGNSTRQFILTLTTAPTSPVVLPPGQTFTVKATTAHANGTSSVNQSGLLVIAAPPCTAPSVTAHPLAQVLTFGGSNPVFSVTASGNVNGYQWQVSTDSGGSWDNIPGASASAYTVVNPVVAMSGYLYRAVVSGCGTNKYSNAASLTVSPATASITLAGLTKTYTGQLQEATVSLSPAGLSGLNVTYNGSATPPTNAGSYNVVATLDNPNYVAAPMSATMEIVKAVATVTLHNLVHTYDGDTKSATAATNAKDQSTFTITYDEVEELPVNHKPGGYAVTATLNNANYAGSASGTLFINKADQVISWAAPASIRYGTPLSATQLNAGLATGNGALAYTPAAETILGAGVHTIRVTAHETQNYRQTEATVSLTVTKATPSITLTEGGPYTYDGMAKNISSAVVTGVINDDLGSASVSYRKSGVPVGRPVETGEYEVLAVFDGNPNYTSAQVTGTLKINKAALSIKANNARKTYGEETPMLTATIESGAVAGESFHVSASSTVTSTTGVGTYAIVPAITGATISNYEVSAINGTLTVDARPITVAAAGKTKVYGDSDPGLTFTIIAGSLVAGDDFEGALGRAAGERVGVYTINQHTLTLGANYMLNYVESKLNITPARLTVTANNANRLCGQSNPQFTGVLEGVKFNDAISASYTTTADATSAVGIYSIVPALSGQALENYTIEATNGTLTIGGIVADASANATPQALKSTATTIAISVYTLTGAVAANVPVTLYFDSQPAVNTLTNSLGVATVTVGVLPAGVYKIRVVAGSGCDETVVYLPIYDPNGGFVTGGGWINSPAGAYKADATLAGKAHFGFVAKYKKGSNIPDGSTEFQFQAGNLNFNSAAYDEMRLVISGTKANYKGVGQINGTGNYGFMVSAIDGDANGGTDKFRIKIWTYGNENDVVYDNNLANTDENAEPATALGGGSIVIHESKTLAGGSTSKKVVVQEAVLPVNSPRFLNYPNPYVSQTTIAFLLDKEESFVLEVCDVKGARVRTVKEGIADAGQLYEYNFSADNLPEGVYFARLVTSSGVKTLKMVLKR
ncbi:MBG domain-containing protein [Pontibacter anaerobius]|uniref:MBG domain-containing protein n=1 Tax=Pontibacter anaerobius TaxID=2993940 RepID=A0ABT3RCQ2_9BACT|nr:MBG domain-containing protein [Pontibacter anaerobius]MCX2739198.1 MBG domain-containing protein [Pontibacter anaerobius]